MARRRRTDRCLRELRERKYRLRGRGKTSRFIPDADSEFARMARLFAGHIEQEGSRLGIAPEQAAKLTGAVEEFRDALSRTMWRDSAGPKATALKNTARAEAEKVVRAVAKTLGANEALTNVDRLSLNIHERPKRMKARSCPQIAPVLRFAGATPGGAKHILEYRNDFDYASNAKPHGAARLELFVEFAPVGGPAPSQPGQLSNGRLWYMRSHTTSRFEVEFPIPSEPMLIVYWGRWADARGGVGPFSKTCVARVEGGDLRTHELMYIGATRPALEGARVSRRVEAKCLPIFVPIARALPDHLEGDEPACEIASPGQRMLEAATVQMLPRAEPGQR